MTTPPPRATERALYEMNPTGRFTDRAQAYRRHRPSYPAGAVDAMVAGLGEPGDQFAVGLPVGVGGEGADGVDDHVGRHRRGSPNSPRHAARAHSGELPAREGADVGLWQKEAHLSTNVCGRCGPKERRINMYLSVGGNNTSPLARKQSLAARFLQMRKENTS